MANRFPGNRDDNWEFLSPLARRIGFCGVGVARAGALSTNSKQIYADWIANGYHADMAYMESHSSIRMDPGAGGLLDGALVVVSAGLPYGDGFHEGGLWPRIAAHARGRDYHRTMVARLSPLAAEIQHRFPGARVRLCVDSAPVSERYWAARCGLGQVGLSGALLVRDVGPAVLLGEIVCANVPLPMETDDPPPDICRRCGRCLDACPTDALNGDGTLDARKCLAYHSVENRAALLPDTVSAKLIGLFGCDICTTVCPCRVSSVVSGLEPATSAAFMPETLEHLLAVEEKALDKALVGTCMKRTGVTAIRRNAGLILRNTRKESE